jgi:hypothetical protein
MSPDRLLPSFKREVIDKNPEVTMIIISPKGFQDIGSERYKKYL